MHHSDPLAFRQTLLLQRLLYGTAPSQLYTMHQLRTLSLDLRAYFVLRCGVQAAGSMEESLEALERACADVREQLADYPCYTVIDSERYAHLILCAPADFSPLRACQAAVRRTDAAETYDLTIGISRHQTDAFALPDAAREANNAQQFAEVDGSFTVFAFEDLPTPDPAIFPQLDIQIALVRTALENNNRAAMQQHYAALCAQTRAYKLSLTALRRIFSFLHMCGQEMLYVHCLDMLTSSVPDRLFTDSTIDELEQSVYDYLMYVLDRIERTGLSIDDLILSVKNYIDQHYAEELSLEFLADQVHLSCSYLSKLFKKELGQNLSTYILNVRLDHAKALLRTTDRKTYEIAESVGISDPVYFSRLFKKATGCTPKDYRMVK